MATLEDVKVEFRDGVNTEGITSRTIDFVKQLGLESENFTIAVSSAARSPYDQARVMYENCENPYKNPKLGVKSQYKLYAGGGDKVIDVYVKGSKAKGSTRDGVISQMHAKILQVGPSRVSKHCVDTGIMNVLDVPFSTIKNKRNFRKLLARHSPFPISRYLDENNNECFHLEFKIADLESFFSLRDLDRAVANDGFRAT